MKPSSPKPTVTPITVQTKRLSRFDQSSTETSSESRIRMPPMVGVPALSWWSGPISRMGWPTRRLASLRISGGPSRKAMNSAVSVAAPVRKVR